MSIFDKRSEQKELMDDLECSGEVLELTMRELTVTRPLLKSGAVSEVDVLRLERDVSRYRGERDMSNAQVPKIQSAISEANRKIQEVELAFRNQASTELSETLAKLSTLGAGSAALQDKVDLTEVKLPEVTDACTESAAAADGMYACDYPVDKLYKAASAGLEAKNPAAFAMLSKFQLTTEQQSEIAGYVDRDGMTPLDAAKKWVEANPDAVKAWLG